MTSKGVQSSLKGFFKPSSPPKTGKRPTAAIDLDADSADEARPSKFQRTSSSAQIAPIDAEENGVEAITSLSVDIEDFELPLNANTFHTIRGPSFRIEDAFSPPSNTGRQITKSLLDFLYLKSFLVAPARKQLYDWLLAELPWYRVRLFLHFAVCAEKERTGLLRSERDLNQNASLHDRLRHRRRSETSIVLSAKT